MLNWLAHPYNSSRFANRDRGPYCKCGHLKEQIKSPIGQFGLFSHVMQKWYSFKSHRVFGCLLPPFNCCLTNLTIFKNIVSYWLSFLPLAMGRNIITPSIHTFLIHLFSPCLFICCLTDLHVRIGTGVICAYMRPQISTKRAKRGSQCEVVMF